MKMIKQVKRPILNWIPQKICLYGGKKLKSVKEIVYPESCELIAMS